MVREHPTAVILYPHRLRLRGRGPGEDREHGMKKKVWAAVLTAVGMMVLATPALAETEARPGPGPGPSDLGLDVHGPLMGAATPSRGKMHRPR